MSLMHSPASPDPLLQELSRCEGRLSSWLSCSQANAQLFAADPVAAIRVAGLGMDENIFKDLQEITGSIARKIQAVM